MCLGSPCCGASSVAVYKIATSVEFRRMTKKPRTLRSSHRDEAISGFAVYKYPPDPTRKAPILARVKSAPGRKSEFIPTCIMI